MNIVIVIFRWKHDRLRSPTFPDIPEIQSSSPTIRRERHRERKYIIPLPLVPQTRVATVGRTPHLAILVFLYGLQHVTRTRGKERPRCWQRPFSLLPPLRPYEPLSPFLSLLPSFSLPLTIHCRPTGRKRDRWLGDVFMMPGAIRQF